MKDLKVSGIEKILLDRANQQIEIIREPRQYRKFLSMISRLRKYWFLSWCLIFMAYPQASLVGGMKTFWNPRSRLVKDKARIRILIPLKEEIPLDALNREIKPADGDLDMFAQRKPQCYRKVSRTYGYKAECVYDISQTNGAPLDDIGKLNVVAEELYVLFRQFVEDKGFDVVEEPIKAKSCADAKTIWVNSELDASGKAKALLYEYSTIFMGHWKFVHMSSSPEIFNLKAESCAYLVGQWLGLDMSDCSFEHMAYWLKAIPEEIFVGTVEYSYAHAKQLCEDFCNHTNLQGITFYDTRKTPVKADERRVA